MSLKLIPASRILCLSIFCSVVIAGAILRTSAMSSAVNPFFKPLFIPLYPTVKESADTQPRDTAVTTSLTEVLLYESPKTLTTLFMYLETSEAYVVSTALVAAPGFCNSKLPIIFAQPP